MAIDTYGALKSQLSTYMFHAKWVAQYDNATTAFERVCNRRLRTRQMEASTNLTTTSGNVALQNGRVLLLQLAIGGTRHRVG